MLRSFLIFLLLSNFLLSHAVAAEVGKFTLVNKGEVVPYDSTCFDNLATAQLLTWREFQKREFDNLLKYEIKLMTEKHSFELYKLQIALEEAQIRFDETLEIKQREIDDLRNIIKKDKKVNLPLAIAGSILGGIVIGVGAAYAIDKAID